MQDITTVNPTKLLVYSITGNESLGILGAATSAAQQTIADARSLMKGSEMLTDLTDASMGKKGNQLPRDVIMPQPGATYNKWQIANKMSEIAGYLSESGNSPAKIAELQARLNVWSSLNGLNDTRLQIPTGEINSMNKALESNVQQGQSNLQGIVQMGSTAVGNVSFSNGLIQQSFG